MDSKTIAPATSDPDPLAAMFQHATIDKAERNEFSNSARDMFKFAVNNYYNFAKEGENLVLQSSDAIDFFRNVVQPFLAEVRKNDQSRSTVDGTTGAEGSDPVSQAVTTTHYPEDDGDPVNVINLVPPEPSSLPVASVADRYTRSMLKCLAGYPLYEPQPLSELSTEYLRHGVNVGDVGFVREDGVFDFLFNICLSKTGLINPPNLPDGFSLELAEHSATRSARAISPKTCLFQNPVTKTNSGEYICEGSEGAVLELPEGAIRDEAMNILPFEQLAGRHGVQWYKYTMTRGRKITNGSLYLITAFTKCAQWGIAVFDRKCAPGQGLKFEKKRSLYFGKSTSKYHWKGSRAFPTKVSNLNKGDASNQCIFLRGYKIMIRQDIFDDLCSDQPRGYNPGIQPSSSHAGGGSFTRQPATRLRGGGGSDPMSKRLTGGGLLSWTKMPSRTKSDEVALYANFNSSLVHPSDVINAALLSQNSGAKVALTHDDVWCDLLRDNIPKLNYATLINIARSYTNIVDEYDCVSLQKIADSSNDLEESPCPLEGIAKPVLQAPLIIPDDDNAPLPASVNLPRELVERILLLLDNKSMLKCKLVNREFNEIIQSSTLLQYFLACKAAGVTDNLKSPLSYAERLEALKKKENAWRKLKPVFEMTISLNRQKYSPVCRSSAGFFFLSDHNMKDLDYFQLTSSPQGDNPRWIRLPGHGPALDWSGTLVNSSEALHEHDLIVNFISSDTEDQGYMQRHSLDLVLLKFSTREYHPLARRPRIHIQRSPETNPLVSSNIVGDNLALVIHSRSGTFSDKLLIFDWKTGCKQLQHEATGNPYSTALLISPELLLVPNHILSHFEVWHLPPEQLQAKHPIQILSLQLPAVSPEYSIFNFRSNGKPNPFLQSMPYLPPLPFFYSPESSIINVTLLMSSNISDQRASYSLVMHRRALLDTIQMWTSPSLLEQQKYLSTWLTNEVTVHQIADPEDGSIGSDAQSKLVSTMPHPRPSPRSNDSPTFPTSHVFADSGSSSVSSGLSTNSSTSRYTFLQVPWAKWGPPITRWFHINQTQAQWIAFSNGQRYVFSEPDPLDRRQMTICVADFNPHNIRRNEEMMGRLRSGLGEGEDNGSNSNNKERREGEEFEILHHKGVFAEEVYMGLKCVVHRTPEKYDFDSVSMDDQRLLGVKLNHTSWHESIKVLYIG